MEEGEGIEPSHAYTWLEVSNLAHYHSVTLPLAEALGFEPSPAVLETAVLPLTLYSYGHAAEDRTPINGLKARLPTISIQRVMSWRIGLDSNLHTGG